MAKKVSVRITDVTDGGDSHVAQITIVADPQEILFQLRAMYEGQIVTRNTGTKKARLRERSKAGEESTD